MRQFPALKERFYSKVDKAGGDNCWRWKPPLITRGGYGQFRIGSLKDGSRRMARAHRVAWEIHNGKIPAGLVVCHKCDNPACVRHDHLFLGTHVDNALDMVNKGRGSVGEDNHLAKLTAEQVRDIRKMRGQLIARKLGELFMVHPQTIHRIWSGYTWSHTK
jgi:hypothetical protein